MDSLGNSEVAFFLYTLYIQPRTQVSGSYIRSPPRPPRSLRIVQAGHMTAQIHQLLMAESKRFAMVGALFRRLSLQVAKPLYLALTWLTIMSKRGLIITQKAVVQIFPFCLDFFGCSYQNKTHIDSRVRSTIVLQ